MTCGVLCALESDDPWYIRDKKKVEENARAKSRRDLNDPLNAMKELVGKKRKSLEGSHCGPSDEVHMCSTQWPCVCVHVSILTFYQPLGCSPKQKILVIQ